MDTLLKNHENGDIIAEDDPYHTYLISAWARICIVLGNRILFREIRNQRKICFRVLIFLFQIAGKDFKPYLPLVFRPVMKTASMKPEVALFDNEDLEDLNRATSDWQFISLGEQQNFGIRTAGINTFSLVTGIFLRETFVFFFSLWWFCAILGLEDKVAACEMLVCYARELKEDFADYAEEVVRLMIPLLKFYFHDGVRTAAAQSLPHLLECVRCKGKVVARWALELWSPVLRIFTRIARYCY